MDLQPGFQKGEIWKSQKKKLIDSIFREMVNFSYLAKYFFLFLGF